MNQDASKFSRARVLATAFNVALGAFVSFGATLGVSAAHAHFKLTAPASWIVEDAQGDPQKDGPCGPAATMTPTNEVTTFHTGETITVEWTETVAHPGHFRIALAHDRAELTDPDIDVDGLCNYTGFDDQTGIYPVLLDNLFPRTGLVATQTFTQEVTLPDEPCEGCTLQVIQFMTNHPPACIYYHCANINVVADGAASDAGMMAGSGGVMATGGAGGMMATTGGVGGMMATTGGVGAAGDMSIVAGIGGAGAMGGAAGVTAGAAGVGVTGGAGGMTIAGTSGSDADSGCAVGHVGTRGAQSQRATSLLGLLTLALVLYRRKSSITIAL